MAKHQEELREVSPEEYRRMQAGRQEQPMNSRQAGGSYELPRFLRSPQWPRTVLSMAVVLVSLLIGFAGGVHYQKQQTTSGAEAASQSGAAGNRFSGQGAYGGRGFHRSGGVGTVSAVSGSSITIQNARTGSSQTFKITSSTTITNNGASTSASDIQAGDTVLIRTSSTDTSAAMSIAINPSFGGGPGINGAPDQPSGSDTQTNTDSI